MPSENEPQHRETLSTPTQEPSSVVDDAAVTHNEAEAIKKADESNENAPVFDPKPDETTDPEVKSLPLEDSRTRHPFLK